MSSNKYSDYLQNRFLRYSLAITAAMYLIFVLFLAINILINTVLHTRSAGREIGEMLEGAMEELEEGLEWLSADSDILRALDGYGNALVTSTGKLYDFANTCQLPVSFLLLDKSGGILSTNLYSNNRAWFDASDIKLEVMERLDEHPKEIYSSISRLEYGSQQAGDYLLGGAVNTASGVKGYLLFDLRDDGLHRKMQPYKLDQVTVADRFDNIVFSTHKIQPDPMDKYPAGRYRLERASRWTARIEENSYFVYRQPFRSGTLQVYALASIAFQRQLFVCGSVILLGMGAILVLIVHRLTLYTTRHNMAFIDELTAAALKIGQGDLGYRVNTKSFDEFQVLGDALNVLSENLQCMIRHNAELAEHQRLLELGQLESQFNPHFIFNTMEAIRYKILLESSEAADMVLTFANLMRYSMNFGTSLIALRSDVSFLKDYLLLQQMRFGNRLEYLIDIEEPLMDHHCPKLLLQPLVENSLGHGARQTRNISIHILGRRVGDEIILTVEDNGDGIPAGKLEELRALLRGGARREARHFGLYSVHRTLRLVYGKQYGLSIESGPEPGTKVTLRMPWKELEPDEAQGADC